MIDQNVLLLTEKMEQKSGFGILQCELGAADITRWILWRNSADTVRRCELVMFLQNGPMTEEQN